MKKILLWVCLVVVLFSISSFATNMYYKKVYEKIKAIQHEQELINSDLDTINLEVEKLQSKLEQLTFKTNEVSGTDDLCGSECMNYKKEATQVSEELDKFKKRADIKQQQLNESEHRLEELYDKLGI